uniref:Putative secreted salivary protein n=1 Tax=Ixodes scapularis TaxID=6945 RepID=Q4PN23_IXOSC|nr:putative secreted salivary protein [Ixodes scapularis]
MFKLRFFILFILAGLCFGETSSNGEGDSPKNGAPSAADSAGGSETTDKSDEKEEADKTNDKSFANTVGLPPWITNSTSFLNTLLMNCHPHNKKETIRNDTINWEKCEYTCRHNQGEEGHKEPLPDNTPCGNGKKRRNKVCEDEPVSPPSCR